MQTGFIPAWIQIGTRLLVEEMDMSPVRTGLLRGTITMEPRAWGVDSLASAVDPRNGYNYARIQHDGGFASGKYGPHVIRGKFYMTIPVMRSPRYALPILDRRVKEIIALCGL